ncbi:MAG: response regulator [Anaerolineales bacterium]|nr:response regulator [Anaerolineales bacterium]
MAGHKRILLVDDDDLVLFAVSEGLQLANGSYEIVTATNGYEALGVLTEFSFDLVITDIKMPQMSGVQLTQEIRSLNLDIPVVWMTAFSSQELKEQAHRMRVYRFLAKPMEVADIRQIAKEALETAVSQQKKTLILPDLDDQLQKRMTQLRSESSAYLVMLTTMSGNPVDAVGVTEGMDISTLSALVAANFLASREISQLLGRESVFKLSYHESNQHNIYAYCVSDKYLLITVFGSATKLGMVWFYTQKAVTDLTKILADQHIEDQVNNAIDDRFGKDLGQALDDLLEASSQPFTAAA